MSKELENERALREFLAGESELGQRYARHSNEEPPQALDRAILAEAQAAVADGSKRGRRWPAPLALAASAVLAVGVVLQIIETGVREPFVATDTPAKSESEAARQRPQRAAQERRDQSGADTAWAIAAPSDIAPLREEVGAAPAGSQPDGSLPVLEARLQNRTAAELNAAQQAALAPPPPELRAASTDSVPLESARDAASPRPAAAESAAESAAATNSATLGAANRSGRVAAEDLEDDSLLHPLLNNQSPAQRETAALSDTDSLVMESQMRRSEGLSALAQSAELLRAPEDWLEDIEDLLEAGRRDEARVSLAEFRKSYPDWPVNDTLRELEP